MWDNKLYEKALFFAVKAHENQKMKFPEDMPYIGHIFGVFGNVVNFCTKEKNLKWDNLVVMSLLHDAIEDTDVTYEQIKDEFNTEIADGVLALTKNDKIEKSLQLADSIERIKKQPKEVAIVKMADRLFNIRCRVPSWSKKYQQQYKKEANYICKELGYGSTNLKRALKQAIKNY